MLSSQSAPSTRRKSLDQLALHRLAVGIPWQRIDDENLPGLLVGVQLGAAIGQVVVDTHREVTSEPEAAKAMQEAFDTALAAR